jgi:ATP phosphoribosyltransferase regulatory subunit
MRTWLLPEHIEDVLPEDARRLEDMRRAVLELFRVHGYQLVMPPMLEYVESLLSGTGHDMDLVTFKLVDQLSGRHMGIRADHTPQVARIDAHLLNRQGVTRLCYAGSVLHTLPSGLTKTREPLQVGAELYGHAGLEADLEVQQLMIDALKLIGLKDVQLDVGHPAIFHALLRHCALEGEIAQQIFHAVQRKDVPALKALCQGSGSEALLALPGLYGDAKVLGRARKELPGLPAITGALDELDRIVAAFSSQGIRVSVDLAELGGFNYESGITFAAFAAGSPDAVARGGRYDEVGKAFGRARPATGFTLDLKPLLELIPRRDYPQGILAPVDGNDPSLAAKIQALRGTGDVVVQELPGHAGQRGELNCDRELIKISGEWRVQPLAQ